MVRPSSAPALTATDPAASAWVSANAGAGKTHLLTDRVTRLLLAGANPSRILCLTYTKAAAAEMAARLFNRLGDWALLSDAELRERLTAIGALQPEPRQLRKARTLFAQALETPGGLKIQTIHSFCQNVLARFPVEAGIPARFTVLDDRSAAELTTAARNSVLERAARDQGPLADAVAALAARATDGRFADILDAAIADRERIGAVLACHGGEEAQFFAHLRRTLGLNEGEDETRILTRFCEEFGRERSLCERVVKWLREGSAGDRKLASDLDAFLAAGAPEHFERLRSMYFTKGNEPRKTSITKARAKAEPELDSYFVALRDRVVAIEQHRRKAVTAALTEALVNVSGAVFAAYDRLKRERAALDYDDLTRLTLALFERHEASWVLYKLDSGLDHLLVDEAQDTSPEQWKIVEKLADEFFAGNATREDGAPRTIFAVGDEKQSIFSFQGADPREFGHHRGVFKARADGAGLPFADLRPAVSRRSARAVLEFVDAVFASEPARDGLTSSADPIQHDPDRAEEGRVELWPTTKAPATEDSDLWNLPVDAPSPASAQAVLASRIATRIARWLRDGTTLPGSDKPITPGDIMILVRRRNAFAQEMVRQLIDKGVPVAGADRMVLMEQIAILDLLALGRFALLPEDDLNLAALLKSPLVGFSQDDLYALAQPREGRRLWDELCARKAERSLFERAYAFLIRVLAQADFLPPFEFYARALSEGLRKRLIVRLGEEAADAIDEFLALALAHEGSHAPSLESFLDWFEKGASEVKRDMEHGGGAVRVMTVHGAKGLEANIVILPDTAQVPDHGRRGPLLYTEDCLFFGVVKALDTEAITEAKNAARLREMREYRRLLYVAATRARELLVICGYETKNGVHPESWYPHLEAAARRIGREELIAGETVIAYGASLGGGAAARPRTQGDETALPAFLTRPAKVEPASRILRPSEAAGADEPVTVSPIGDQGKRFQRGLLVHALLARLPEIASPERESVAFAYLQREGLQPEDAETLAKETFAILNDARFAVLFGPNSRAEVAITARLPELYNARVSGQIDRLAVTEETVLIADFKTNRPPPKTANEVALLYRTQMALYRAAMAKIYPGKRIDCALIWTDGALLMPLPAALLDAEIERIAKRDNAQHLR